MFLETERLVLRKFQEDDFDDFCDVLLNFQELSAKRFDARNCKCCR